MNGDTTTTVSDYFIEIYKRTADRTTSPSALSRGRREIGRGSQMAGSGLLPRPGSHYVTHLGQFDSDLGGAG